MRVDAHHHLWDPTERAYPWMTGDAAVLAHRFSFGDLREAMAPTPVEMTVLVQTVSDQVETQEFLTLAAQSGGIIAGVVGWLDLQAADVSDRLRATMGSAAGHLLVGLRHQVHDEADSRWLLRDDVQRGIRAVRDLGLVFDLLVRARELPAAIELARLFPDLPLVLDHLGKPPSADRGFEPWAGLVTELAAEQNVSCKLSGLVTEAGPDANAAEFARYVDHAIEAFGVDRVMFGSDWPVCTTRTTYEGVYTLALELLHGLTAAELDAVMGDNAVRIYGLL